MKKRSLLLLPLAAALALTGCSGSNDEGSTEGTEQSTQSQQASESGQAAESQPGTQTGTAEGDALTGAEVKAVVEALVAGEEGAQVLDGDTIAASLPQAKAAIEAMNIKPEQCAELIAQQGSWDLEGVNMAVATITEGMSAQSITVASYADEDKLEQARDSARSMDMQGCESFSMETQGQKMEASATMEKGSSDAEVTVITRTTVTMDGVDVPMDSVSVQAFDGRTSVAAAASGEIEDNQELVDSLVEEINNALAEVEKAG